MTQHDPVREQAILARIAAGDSHKDIARDFGLSTARISQIKTRAPRRDFSRRIVVGHATWDKLRAAANEIGAEPAEFAGRLLKVALARGERV